MGLRSCCGLAAALLALSLAVAPAAAAVYELPPDGSDLVGQVRYATVAEGETLLDIGRRNGVGFKEMQRANPGIDMWIPDPGTRVTLPTQHILPDAPREGIVLNVAEMRLYYYPPAQPGEAPMVETYPVSIGRMDWSTPLGESRITQKLLDPAWYPPASVREAAAARGETLPPVVPPGPDNPIGPHALRLNIPGYFIHSTNQPWGVGMRVTHGCVRMYPEDIEDLYDRIPLNTKVRIVNQPYKVGWAGGTLFMQAHPPLEEDREALARGGRHAYTPALDVVNTVLGRTRHRIDHYRLREALERESGVPVPISRIPGSGA